MASMEELLNYSREKKALKEQQRLQEEQNKLEEENQGFDTWSTVLSGAGTLASLFTPIFPPAALIGGGLAAAGGAIQGAKHLKNGNNMAALQSAIGAAGSAGSAASGAQSLLNGGPRSKGLNRHFLDSKLNRSVTRVGPYSAM